jgi:hypothetical protein
LDPAEFLSVPCWVLEMFINSNSYRSRYKTIRDKIGNWQ